MILDLEKFIREERPVWNQLETLIEKFEHQNNRKLSIQDVETINRLYRRSTSDLSKIQTYTANPEILNYLENLCARAYSEIHSQAGSRHRLRPFAWLFVTFPNTFRRHIRAFAASVLITLIGVMFGAFALAVDQNAKAVIMPFPHLQGNPSDRVADEEKGTQMDSEMHFIFASQLMTHNTRVSITTLAFGILYGIGTLIMLFYNGVILGAVSFDYIHAGESVFLTAWLLPHGSIEIPAILIAGQAGFVIAFAMIGRHQSIPLRQRLRLISADVVTLIFGIALLLVWAGIIESFFSQYHYPVVSYAAKILFGGVQLALLVAFLGFSGRNRSSADLA